MSSARKNISIEKKFYDLINERIKSNNNDFESADEYVNFVLNQVLLEDNEDNDTKEVEDELKKLGYI